MLTYCLEVVEHCHEREASKLIKTLNNNSEMILFSAEVADQANRYKQAMA